MKIWMHDLRFFIGAFFFLVGVLLLGQGVLSPMLTDGVNLNLDAGLGFLVFSSVALLSLRFT